MSADAATDDFELLEAWRAGDNAAGQSLARRHYTTIRRFVSGKVDEDTAREITQRTLLTICEKRDDFAGYSTFKAYVRGVARFKLISFYERARIAGERFDPLASSIFTPELQRTLASLFAGAENERTVAVALRKLPLDDQFLLELKAVEGLKNREVGEIMGMTTAAVGGRVNRARDNLRKAIKEMTDDPALRAIDTGGLDRWVASVCKKMPAKLRDKVPED